MPDRNDGHETLTLLDDFPSVPTPEWEEAIRRDLKGADYDKKLVWKTDEGIAIRPYYRAEDATPWPALAPASRGWRMVGATEAFSLDVSAVEFHEAGATAVQEIAYALALAADRLASDQEVVVAGFAVGGNHFMEIAKFRAARILLEQVRSAFAGGASAATDAASVGATAAVHLHARTAAANTTLYDPYMNLLRATTEALSAILGGCDSLLVVPCRFDPHLADNVQRILREESHLDQVADPGAGSYYVEALTDALACEAWGLFQRVEAAGGFSRYRESGALDAALAKARADKERAVASRRRVLVGTNNFPDTTERALDAAPGMPQGWRLAAPIEAVRLRTERHARATGRTPRVLLLERGDLKMRKARAAFSLNFFGCGGFEIVTSETLEEADLVVLCGADDEYLGLAREVCGATRAPVVVAGNPKSEAGALEAIGVAGFVHLGSDLVDTLTLWQDRLGIEA